jgi:phosphoglycolate phosphatase
MVDPAQRYDLVVFDWDGTLVDSPRAIVECIQQASVEIGLPMPAAEVASHTIGLGMHESLRIAVPELPSERYLEFAALYRKHFVLREDRMGLFAGVQELLAALGARGRKLAVATGKSRRGLERALDSTGTRHLFAATRCADETRPKPDPAMLLELMDELEIEPSRTVMIGDTSHDLEMARSAGVDAIAVAYGAHPGHALLALAPRCCAADVAALHQWLERNA